MHDYSMANLGCVKIKAQIYLYVSYKASVQSYTAVSRGIQHEARDSHFGSVERLVIFRHDVEAVIAQYAAFRVTQSTARDQAYDLYEL